MIQKWLKFLLNIQFFIDKAIKDLKKSKAYNMTKNYKNVIIKVKNSKKLII